VGCGHGEYHTMGDVYLKSSSGSKIGTRYFYIAPYFSTAYSGVIKDAVLCWNVCGNMQLVKTTSVNSAQLRILHTNIEDGLYGATKFRISSDSSIVDHAVTSNYQYAYVYLRDKALGNYILARVTTIHETGHALGLLHVECSIESIMAKYLTSPNHTDYLTSFDISSIYHVYC